MHSIGIVIPYFGKLPECFPAWWVSARANDTVDFIFVTDNTALKSEGNLHVKHMTFEECKERFQCLFDFEIKLESPYKLCDYKPVYGDVFRKELQEYDFWGYCDVDLVFGNIRKFLTEEILSKHDRILIDGHLSLYRNYDQMTLLYRAQGVYPEYNYQEVFTTDEICFFDEYRGMELKCIRLEIPTYCDNIYVDALPNSRQFVDARKVPIIGEWNKGTLVSRTKDGLVKEILYMHVCRRKMTLNGNPEMQTFFIVPGQIICQSHMEEGVFEHTSGGKLYVIKYYLDRFLKLSKQYSIQKLFERRKRMKDVSAYKKKLLRQKERI